MALNPDFRFLQLLGKIHPGIYAAAIAGAVLWAALSPGKKPEPPIAQAVKPVVPTAQERCTSGRQQQLADYKAKLDKGLPWQAASALRFCAGALADPELKALVTAAEIADAELTVKNKKAPLLDRFQAIDRIVEADPSRASEFKSLKAQLDGSLASLYEDARQYSASHKSTLSLRLGMSQRDVMSSPWGSPDRINKTVNSFGVHEQWVYGDGNYLYFQDGVLESFQTGN